MAEAMVSSIKEILVVMEVIATSTSLSFLSAQCARLASVPSTKHFCSSAWVVNCCRRVEACATLRCSSTTNEFASVQKRHWSAVSRCSQSWRSVSMADLVLRSEARSHISRRRARAASHGSPTNSDSTMSLSDPSMSSSSLPPACTAMAIGVSFNHPPADFVSSVPGKLHADRALMASDNSLTIAGVGGVGGDPLTNRATAWNSFYKVQVLPDIKTDKAKAPPEGETG